MSKEWTLPEKNTEKWAVQCWNETSTEANMNTLVGCVHAYRACLCATLISTLDSSRFTLLNKCLLSPCFRCVTMCFDCLVSQPLTPREATYLTLIVRTLKLDCEVRWQIPFRTDYTINCITQNDFSSFKFSSQIELQLDRTRKPYISPDV